MSWKSNKWKYSTEITKAGSESELTTFLKSSNRKLRRIKPAKKTVLRSERKNRSSGKANQHKNQGNQETLPNQQNPDSES